jgi:hypothetical protein
MPGLRGRIKGNGNFQGYRTLGVGKRRSCQAAHHPDLGGVRRSHPLSTLIAGWIMLPPDFKLF